MALSHFGWHSAQPRSACPTPPSSSHLNQAVLIHARSGEGEKRHGATRYPGGIRGLCEYRDTFRTPRFARSPWLTLRQCHGELDAIYSSVRKAEAVKGSKKVDLVVIGGDFQASRNPRDLTLMAVPRKYRRLGDFPDYYNGRKKAPYLTLIIGGNHEAASHFWELYYGGWVAPNIYYLGAANVVRFGPLRIAGMSGIWKGYDYNKQHMERIPFNESDIKSFYHVREIDVRKLLLLREQVDVGLSHDWPRGIEKFGPQKKLWKLKPDFEQESRDGTFGNPAATYVLDRLRPAYWMSAHLHCKYEAIKRWDHGDETAPSVAQPSNAATPSDPSNPQGLAAVVNQDEIALDQDDDGAAAPSAANPDEIGLDLDDEEVPPPKPANPEEIDLGLDDDEVPPAKPVSPAPADMSKGDNLDDLRAQLPASFARPTPPAPRGTPGQPVPETIVNKITRFLALDKPLPGRKYLQFADIVPVLAPPSAREMPKDGTRPANDCKLQYDPEWLAITRVFHKDLVFGDRQAKTPENLGEAAYVPMIEKERAWVEENIVQKGKLEIPENFELTAPPMIHGHKEGMEVEKQPTEYTNPQTAAFCQLLDLPNLWDATPEERETRRSMGPPPDTRERSSHPRGGGRGGAGGRHGRGRGGRGRGNRG